MAGSQTLAFNIVGDANSAARAFKSTADTAALAARGAKMASDALNLQTKSAQVSTGATLALARADKVLADAELGLARDTAVANAVLGKQNAALLGSGTAGAVGSMLAAAASGKVPSGGGGSGGMAPGVAMAAAALGIASQNTRLFSDSISQGTPVWASAGKGILGLNGALRGVNGELQLFGGALTSVGIPHILSAATTFHLLSEAVIETAGTLIPAAIAFSAFGAAAVPAAQDIYTQMSNLNTIAKATGTQIPGLSGGFSRMAAAVQPQVYQLFGDALVIANHGTGQLQTLATGAGKVLDDLAARFTAATTQGKGFSTFIGSATSDLAGWGNLIGNIGGIFGNLLKVLPGYAEQILSVLQSVTHGIEAVTGSGLGQWVLGIGLAAHGAVFYIGILGTGLAVLASRGLAGIAVLALNAATGLEGLGVAGKAASAGMLAFAGAAEGAAGLPWGWLSIAAAGVGFLVYQMLNAKTAAEQFGAAMQDAITHSSLNMLEPTIAGAIGQAATAAAAARAQAAAAAAKQTGPTVAVGAPGAAALAAPLSAPAAAAASQYTQVLSGLQAQQQLVASRVNALSKEFGGQTQALAALNDAGITAAQITSKDASTWGQAKIEIEASNAALKEMNISTGALGSDYVNTLLPAVAKVTGAQDALLSGITGGRTAYDTFQQGIGTLAQNFDQASGSGAAVNETLGKLKATASLAGATLNGTSQASYALNQAFYTQVTNGQKVIDSLEAQGVSSKDLATATATMSGQMLSFAGNNKEARSVLVDLINNALGPGTVSMKSLDSWTGKNSTTMAGFQSIVAKSTIAAGNLAGTLSGLANQAFAAELFQASGAAAATKKFADAIQSSGDHSDATKSARAKLIGDLEKAGYSAQGAGSLVAGMQKQIDNLHGKTVSVSVAAKAQGTLNAISHLPGQNPSDSILTFKAAGGMISGGTPGKDSVVAALMPGEVVVPTPMVAAGAVDHLRGKLPGFAAGGGINLAGPQNWAAGAEDKWGRATALAWAQAADKKFQAAAAALTANPGGSGVTRWAPDILRVLAQLGQPASDLAAVEHRISVESGGNPNAINLTDSNARAGYPSQGLMQTIPQTFANFAGPYKSLGIDNGLASIYAGVNYALHAYAGRSLESVMLQAGGYDNGGPLMPGYTLAYNGTGKPEMVMPNGAGSGGGEVHLHIHNEGVIGSQAEVDAWLENSVNRLARGSRLRWALTQSPSSR